jgi:hypothetical protein
VKHGAASLLTRTASKVAQLQGNHFPPSHRARAVHADNAQRSAVSATPTRRKSQNVYLPGASIRRLPWWPIGVRNDATAPNAVHTMKGAWKDAVGDIHPVPELPAGEMLCPLCHAEHHGKTLRLEEHEQVWRCARRHGYHFRRHSGVTYLRPSQAVCSWIAT